MQVESCDRFWFQPNRERVIIEKFFDEINPVESSRILESIVDQDHVQIAEILAARSAEDGNFYRAKVINMDKICEQIVFTVIFIDFGTITKCDVGDLLKIRNENYTEQTTLPPRCFLCCLAEVQPSVIHAVKNVWNKDANDLLVGKVRNKRMEFKVEVNLIVKMRVNILFISIKKFNSGLFSSG